MAKENIEETKQEFKLICTSINDGDKTVPVIVGGIVKDDKWVNPSDFTFRAIEAVRDYLLSQIEGEDKGSGYQWKSTDGKCVKLMLTIENENANEAPTVEIETTKVDELAE